METEKNEKEDVEQPNLPSAESAPEEQPAEATDSLHDVTFVSGMYENWFLDYASYVILERAVPAIEDGLKPVQRRILHAMKEMDDGRFNKVANIIGQTMQYHPHGDAAIGDAMVNLGQKDLLNETQGNWGDINTGDSAAAARYIEARLSKFALEVAFNAQTTKWQLSYDGRKKEPVTLPMKFPLLLAQGVEGIAVGLSTKVLPHNFNELISASIAQLKGKPVQILPDFPTGGSADFSNYNEGQKGSRVRIRARIEEKDKRTLLIRDIPYGTTTTSVMESIVKANDAGKIRIKKVIDNTAENVEIEVQLHAGTSPDVTIDALYAFTECETSVSPNACVIVADKPIFVGVNELLHISTNNTVRLLKLELEIKLRDLEEKWHFASLEKIFIEKRIYRKIEDCETWEAVISTIDHGLKPYKKLFKREITVDDITRLTEIKIKRISKYDGFKADEAIRALEDNMQEAKYNLEHLTDFAINYFKELQRKYGKGRDRKTEIRTFDTINASVVAVANQKLYVNRKEGFIGYGLKKDEFVCDCSDIDDIIVFKRDGRMVVTRASEKTFVGKDIIHVGVWKKGDDRMIYNMAYMDGRSGIARAKRFAVTGVTRDKEYDLTMGNNGSRVLYFTANPNSEAEVVTITMSPNVKTRKPVFDFDFSSLEIKGRSSQGNILSKHAIRSVKFKEKGSSTLGGRDIWYDKITGRLNVDKHGKYLGNFETEDHILVLYKDGSYELTNWELTNRYDPAQVEHIRKFDAAQPITAVYFDGNNKTVYLKKFLVETTTLDKKFSYITDNKHSRMLLATLQPDAEIMLRAGKKKKDPEENLLKVQDFEVRGWKALGTKITSADVIGIELLNPPTGGEGAHPLDEDYEPSSADNETAIKTEPLRQAIKDIKASQETASLLPPELSTEQEEAARAAAQLSLF
jgi:topoisomerase-4 subunit A